MQFKLILNNKKKANQIKMAIFGVIIKQINNRNVHLYRKFSISMNKLKMMENVPNNYLDKSILNKFKKLPYDYKNKVQATYLWIDGTCENVRLKDQILDFVPKKIDDLPNWSYCGSATYQGVGNTADRILAPKALYKDPFKTGPNDVIVLCDTYIPDGTPTESNKRAEMQSYIDKTLEHQPWFGIEQEYTLLDINGRPFGWPANGFPAPQGPYYCGVGANRVYARDLSEAHTVACLYAGIDFAGTNSEVMPAQWEYQIGPSLGMKAADDLWVSRYILWRIAEEFGVIVSFHPKPIDGNWNGAGAHTNYSTATMRADGGIKAIEAAIKKLELNHEAHIRAYDPKEGEYNKLRLSGLHETSSIDKFTWGIADRGASVRIARSVVNAGKGFLEDRRPSSNMDPYAVCSAILKTTLLN